MAKNFAQVYEGLNKHKIFRIEVLESVDTYEIHVFRRRSVGMHSILASQEQGSHDFQTLLSITDKIK